MSRQLTDALKEGARVVALAVIPIIIADLSQGGGVNWQVIAVAGTIAFLRFIDKWLHLVGKKEHNEIKTRGLTQF